jgi:phospholipase C
MIKIVLRKAMRRSCGLLLALTCFGVASAKAQIANFEHIVVIVQENRTPDNLFYALCSSSPCSAQPSAGQYNIQTSDWLDKTSSTGVTQPVAAPLAVQYSPNHEHESFTAQCDMIPGITQCQMDGAAGVGCVGVCPVKAEFSYVDNSTGILNPYLTLATQYGWANYMFQTNQGPSFPAHQFIFGATSAPTTIDDHDAIFASENTPRNGLGGDGCAAAPGQTVQLIDPVNGENPDNRIFPCFEHLTVADILTQAGYSWRYYGATVSSLALWVAPGAIDHICQASAGVCTGPDFLGNVDLHPADVLSDIGNCALRSATWVTPTGQNSDHPDNNTGGGPSWVASIVNAIGNSQCLDQANKTYWQTTAILITWDDWGGWYDHVPPEIYSDYQYGFRVPLIFVSAYTAQGYIDNDYINDFGSIARFIENNFGIQEGVLTFADARSSTDLTNFVDLGQPPRNFNTIVAPLDARHFLNDKSRPLPPDDD